MAKEHSMDIVVKFDFQEIKNAVDQAQREASTRYDLANSDIEIDLNEERIKINVETENQMEAVYGILLKKIISRNQSAKILKRGTIKPCAKMRFEEEMPLTKTMDQENAKKISKSIRDKYPKAKASIQGESIRVSSKSIDDLQDIIKFLKSQEDINLPLDFKNYK
ncbi:YajQ family cyclic di-GMP-binding protein [Patescibacteria group bacterium]